MLSSFLFLIFMLGLVQGVTIKYASDTAMVLELDHQDHQDDSEADVDELDFNNLPNGQILLLKDFSNENRGIIATNLNLNIQIIRISQPTPPPEYIG
ncbi:hypothetical protein HPE56_09265 [Maribacter sp. ANRC-HE7]|uniref:Uncharacterized protein n=1 Tax=Maribacter aquimaris TaxID=2737171 RepID=A0ABR7V0F3_9FLAO|nr:hypothetical protein [Maribacter aquimaris]MBD0777982.1 hypothetical protein [Maribacter aquimaris]